ncbi:enolase C-terminal domain-like protein [Rubellicoccus peritrichatus]|uniref:Enolase C-terminal domain-like protein n=1 Tax=Rubellicoccus peritrichatus TaxID=3080537 RepID=A0AAQ3QUU1_9BACT|nr:enolase C-terminal domain-like protein [Puniceicoccus sp. CR14]WOO40758.1 enolase C-terminal domain-like protein [Puniceicoccus sp. CR14]
MISNISTSDQRFPLAEGEGIDAIHQNPVYSYSVTQLEDDSGITGTGLAFTLGGGNDLVCQVAQRFAERFKGCEIEEIMSDFGTHFHALAEDPQMRWLGPHKGVVHLALASVTNACFDLWAKKRGLPLWKLLLELTPEQFVATLDLTYLEDVLTRDEAIALLQDQHSTRSQREAVIKDGYPGYDTSVGWFNYSDELVRENCKKAIAEGFSAMKLKVGSADPDRDIRRANIVREVAGPDAKVMVDANQQWNLPDAIKICNRLRDMNPFWIEEPTHPDDILGHRTLADEIKPLKLAAGEHMPNRIIFKNYLQSGSLGFVQVDAVRVGGVSEFLAISLMAKKYGLPVVPHVGDMGQIHQHLVIANHIAMGHEALFLEHIPHLRQHFTQPAVVEQGVYRTPMEPGSSSDLIGLA